MRERLSRKTLVRAGALVLAALVLAVGLEWLMQRTLPPIYVDRQVEFPDAPDLMQRSGTYLHSSGREALVEEWNSLRLAATFALQLVLLTILFPLGVGKRLWSWLRSCVQGMLRSLRQEQRKNLKRVLLFLVAFVPVFLIARAWIWDVYHRDHWIAITVAGWSGVAAGLLAAFYDQLGRKPETFFLVLILIFGGMLSFFLLPATGVSLDDGFHFQHALNYSTLGHVRFTDAEWEAMDRDNVKEYNLEKLETITREQDEKYHNGAIYVTTGFHPSPKEGWMATYGLGLFLGRVLGLRFWEIWSLGRFTGLLAYGIICYFAIHRLKSGKMILAMVLMMPSCVFLAANYSYDPGVIAGMAISCSYWIAQWQEPDQRLRKKDVAVMLAGMLFACYVKAIYFPVFLLLLFLPEGKLPDRKQQRSYRILVLLAMVLIMLHILVPLGQSGGEGDSRGEGNVNTFGQIQFILQNPLAYLEILWHFLQGYLDPNRMGGLVCSYGYQGGGDNAVLVLILMALVTFTDAPEDRLRLRVGIRAFGEVLLFGSLVLMITAMYAWFTEVGSPLIDGVQNRYMIPFLFPAMALLGSGRTRNRGKQGLYNGLMLAAMFFAGVSGMMVTLIEYYN